MVAGAININLISEVLVDGVVFMDVVTGGMESGVRNGNYWSIAKSLDTGFNLGCSHRNVERRTLLGGIETLETIIIHDVIGSKISAWCCHASYNCIKFGSSTDVTLIIKNITDIFDSIGQFLEFLIKFLFDAILFDGADNIVPFHFEVQATDFLVVAIETILARGRARIGDKK